jgi:ABC-2 type transport system ATP-binding protein
MLHTTEVTNWCVDLIGVKKTYGRKIEALRGINVQVRRGEIFGLLGPNGAGKSTLVKIMMTIVRPDEVHGTILGRPIGNRKKLAVTGYLPEFSAFPRYLTAFKVLDYCGALARVPRSVRRRRAADLLGRVGLTGWEDTRCGKYSKGMLRRLGLAQALINDPELIVLDEPTDGLDPIGRREIRELVKELRDAGKTVFLNSHLLSEIEMVCDRVAILNQGLVARQGTLSELTSHTVEFVIMALGDVEGVRSEIERHGGVVEAGRIVSRSDDVERVNRIIDVLRQHKCLIESVEPQRFSLEDVFVEVVGDRSGVVQDDSNSGSSSK